MRQRIYKSILAISLVALAAFAFQAQYKLGAMSEENGRIADKLSIMAEQAGKATPQQIQQQVDEGGFQAVFLDDTANPVYFGKLTETNANYLSLAHVYYVSGSPAPGTKVVATVDNMKLVKLGSEIHGPKDYMYIPQGKVQFIENLKSSSKIVKAIKSYESKHQR